jgi:coproporphyrinogen III oxidase-like Fe-S oxidoreductase
MLMLGLRCADGVAEEEVAHRCGLAPRQVFGREIGELCERGLIAAEGGVLRIVRDRWLVSNEVLQHFVV